MSSKNWLLLFGSYSLLVPKLPGKIPFPSGRWKSAGFWLLKSLACSLSLLGGVTVLQAQGLPPGGGGLRVMTYNVDEGTDFIEVENATTTTQFLVAVGQTITQVRATNPPARMSALARQILAAQPDLVSLQEVDHWYSGSLNPFTGACGPTSLEFDMLQELLDALAVQGGHYQVAVRATELAFPPTPGLILPGTFLCVQVLDENVILARTDLKASEFQWSNPRSAQFVNKVYLPTPLGLIPVPRVWVSVDAQFHGTAFRFIGTHFDTVAPIRELQGAELRNGPANVSLPVIVAMDSNAQAYPLPEDPTYMDFIVHGYNDVWNELSPLGAGTYMLPGAACKQSLVSALPKNRSDSDVGKYYARRNCVIWRRP